MLLAVNEELFPDSRQRPLGQSAGGHNDPLPQLQRVNNKDKQNTENDNGDGGNATDNGAASDDESAEDSDAADSDGAGDSSDDETE